MKRYPNFILSLSFLLLFLFIGCNIPDSEDEETNGTAPTISNVVFYKCDDSEKNNSKMSISFNDHQTLST